MEEYDLELDKAVESIKNNNAKFVCIQLPDGLKPKAGEIVQFVEQKAGCTCVIWLGSCYGACDVPVETEKAGVDLIIQWGHSEWH